MNSKGSDPSDTVVQTPTAQHGQVNEYRSRLVKPTGLRRSFTVTCGS
jgi:hypothetical protein